MKKNKLTSILLSAITSVGAILSVTCCSCRFIGDDDNTKCTITFQHDENSSFESGDESVEVTKGTKWYDVTKPVVKANVGYQELGWFNGDTKMTDETVIDENVTIKYKVEEISHLYFEDNIDPDANEPSTIKYQIVGNNININIEYSFDGKVWNPWTENTEITIDSSTDEKRIYVKNKTDTLSVDVSNYVNFVMTGSIASGGNIDSLINYKGLSKFSYYKLFYECVSLTTPPNLPATTVLDSSYYEMFSGCTTLQFAPELPATAVEQWCYYRMFFNCSSLKRSPKALPASTLSICCYREMFGGCSNLETVPSLPATELATNCYNNMFSGCNKLSVAPELPAINLANGCYVSMFNGCSNLEIEEHNVVDSIQNKIFYCPDELPTNTVDDMFNGCKKIGFDSETPRSGGFYSWRGWLCFADANDTGESTVKYTIKTALEKIDMEYSYDCWTWNKWKKDTPITIDSETDKNKIYVRNKVNTLSSSDASYVNFVMTGLIDASGKTNSLINYSQLTTHCFYKLFDGCESLQTAPLLLDTTLKAYCYESMFSGCTRLNTTPILNATQLATSCYENMFANCIGLHLAPQVLPAETLFERCYSGMFSGCKNLINIPSLMSVKTLASFCCYSMFYDCSNLYITDSEESETTLFFLCPVLTSVNDTKDMFHNCAGKTDDPIEGNNYYWRTIS